MTSALDPLQRAGRIGSRYARNALFAGLGIAVVIMVVMGNGTLALPRVLLTEFPVQAVICIAGGPVVAHMLGGWAGRMVLVKRANATVVSLVTGFGSVWTTSILFCLVGLVQEGGSEPTTKDALVDYVVGPIWGVTFCGGLPIIVVSLIMARLLRKRRREFA